MKMKPSENPTKLQEGVAWLRRRPAGTSSKTIARRSLSQIRSHSRNTVQSPSCNVMRPRKKRRKPNAQPAESQPTNISVHRAFRGKLVFKHRSTITNSKAHRLERDVRSLPYTLTDRICAGRNHVWVVWTFEQLTSRPGEKGIRKDGDYWL